MRSRNRRRILLLMAELTYRGRAITAADILYIQELIAPHPATLEDCVIEFESAGGGKMRIHCKAAAPPDWAGLLRAWRDTEG